MARRALGTVDDAAGAAAPPEEVVAAACDAGFRSVDEGEPFAVGFVGTLHDRGYTWVVGSECICIDRGRHGHTAACHWVRSGDPT